MSLHAILHLDFSDGHFQDLRPIVSTSLAVEMDGQASRHLVNGGIETPLFKTKEPPRTRDSRLARGLARIRNIQPNWRLAGAVAALAASIMFVTWQLWPDSLQRPMESSTASSSGADHRKPAANDQLLPQQTRAVAVLGRTSRAKWSDTNLPLNNGASLLPGKFNLEKGLVQIEMFSGASVVIEGPAEFELISPKRMTCDLGKIRANVPTQAIGFTITTPTHSAIDLGTEFTVQVEPTGVSEFQVLDGEVDLRMLEAAQSAEPKRLLAGESVRSVPNGELTEVPVTGPSQFIGGEQLLKIATAALRERYSQWKKFSQTIRNDPNVVVYYGFDGHEPWERVLRNESPLNSDLLQGAIVGCQWTTGRWDGKQALEFKRTTDRVRLNVPGEFESLTFAAWLRIEGLERWLSSLMLTDGHQPGEVHWQMTDRGQLLLGVKVGVDICHDFYSPPIITAGDLGQWVHLACVYNGKDGYVSHVVNGAEVSRDAIEIPAKLRLGSAEIGNWVPQDLRNYRVRSLNGRIDEFILFNSPLTTEQIQAIYDAGKPQS